jgi:hypothetical protein
MPHEGNRLVDGPNPNCKGLASNEVALGSAPSRENACDQRHTGTVDLANLNANAVSVAGSLQAIEPSGYNG